MAGWLGPRFVVLAVALVLAASAVAWLRAAPRGPTPAAGSLAAYANPGLLTRQGLVLPTGASGSYDDLQVGHPSVLVDSTGYRMWYFACSASYTCTIALATSPDGRSWSKQGPITTVNGTLTSAGYPTVIKVGSTYWMYYNVGGSIDAATSADGVVWGLHGVVLNPGLPGSADGYMVAYPHALYAGGEYRMYYTGISSPTPPNAVVMLATSADGLAWTKSGVVVPMGTPGSYDSFSVSSGSVALVGGTFEMAYLGQENISDFRILYAESSDGRNWTKTGLALTVLPSEEWLMAQPDLVLASNGTWLVYYAGRADVSDLQIFLATGVATGTGTTMAGSSPLVPVLLITGAGAAGIALFAWAARRPKRPLA